MRRHFSVLSHDPQARCGQKLSVNYGSPSPFDGITAENTVAR
ncbi:hypothetical protein [uncultured Muribaculum sp.]|nr:hypothetical protein [uncultured Muribaculum sp.]